MQLTPQGWAYYNMNRPQVDRHFNAKFEYEVQAYSEKNKERKQYLLGQAALRDTKARELLEKIITTAKSLGTKMYSKEAIYSYANGVECNKIHDRLRSNLNFSWWNTWMSNF